MKKTPEEIAEMLARRGQRIDAAKGAAMWPNALARVTVEAFARSEVVTRTDLIKALESWAENRDALLKAGSDEAIARLRQAIAEGMREQNDGS